MADLHFITAEVCPYAQRTHLALREKGLDYEHTEVDLKNPCVLPETKDHCAVPVRLCLSVTSFLNDGTDHVEPAGWMSFRLCLPTLE